MALLHFCIRLLYVFVWAGRIYFSGSRRDRQGIDHPLGLNFTSVLAFIYLLYWPIQLKTVQLRGVHTERLRSSATESWFESVQPLLEPSRNGFRSPVICCPTIFPWRRLAEPTNIFYLHGTFLLSLSFHFSLSLYANITFPLYLSLFIYIYRWKGGAKVDIRLSHKNQQT